MHAIESSSALSPADEVLVERARDGDGQAASELVLRYRDAMARFCFGYLGHLQDAEDAAQDVLAVVNRSDRLPPNGFRRWLYRVARNRCLNLLKQRKDGRAGAGSVVNDSRWASPRTGPRTALLRREREEEIRRLLSALPDHQREVLILRYFVGLCRREIAEVLDVPDSIIKSRLFEAGQRLREQLRDSEASR